jgi:hypothetical protein
MCVKKRRFLDKDQKTEKRALMLFKTWNKFALGSTKEIPIQTFIASRYYVAFVLFGKYIGDAKVINPTDYLRWLVDGQVRIDSWTKDSTYSKFLLDYTKKETPERAMERFMLHVIAWADATGKEWQEYLDAGNMNRVVHDITMGKISPWVLLASADANELLMALPPEMFDSVANTFDLAYWGQKVNNDPESANWINGILT